MENKSPWWSKKVPNLVTNSLNWQHCTQIYYSPLSLSDCSSTRIKRTHVQEYLDHANRRGGPPFTISDSFRPRYGPNVCLLLKRTDDFSESIFQNDFSESQILFFPLQDFIPGWSSPHTFVRFYNLDIDMAPGSQILSVWTGRILVVHYWTRWAAFLAWRVWYIIPKAWKLTQHWVNLW